MDFKMPIFKKDKEGSIDSKPEIIDPSKSDNEFKVPKSPKAGIKVIAMRQGFFGQQRVKKGQEFTIKSFDDVGEWMKCIDPLLEKKKLKIYEDKKARN